MLKMRKIATRGSKTFAGRQACPQSGRNRCIPRRRKAGAGSCHDIARRRGDPIFGAVSDFCRFRPKWFSFMTKAPARRASTRAKTIHKPASKAAGKMAAFGGLPEWDLTDL